ncbi:MAG: hypothetical protein ACTSRH_10940 [Promethearchaeota archaeon]
MNTKQIKEEFSQFILSNNVIGFFETPIKLKSGRLSYYYINWRTISEDVFLLDKLADFIISFTESLNLKPDCFYGVPEGATKIALITQYKWAKKQPDFTPRKYILPMGRGKPKNHGEIKDKFYLGAPKGKIIVLEDTTTTGSSLLKCLEDLKQIDVDIIAVIALTNRNEITENGKIVEELVNDLGIKYYAMSEIVDLLPKLKIDENIKDHLKKYFKKYGYKKINL